MAVLIQVTIYEEFKCSRIKCNLKYKSLNSFTNCSYMTEYHGNQLTQWGGNVSLIQLAVCWLWCVGDMTVALIVDLLQFCIFLYFVNLQ